MTSLTLSRPDGGRWIVAALRGDAAGGTCARDASGAPLPIQTDWVDGRTEVVVDAGEAAPGPVRLEPGGAAPAGEAPAVRVERVEDWQGQAAWRIETTGCAWVYHEHGAGFASLIDRDGKDWLSFRPHGGSDGRYRGIPNLAHPENVFHPGAETCTSRLTAEGPLRATIESESKDGAWACRWHVYPDHAELTVLRVGHPYWLLYEGTPWGALDEGRDVSIRSDGLRRSLSERWDEVLPEPKWIAFGKESMERTLWLRSHAPENAPCRDSYWPMEGNMTVFGFGRLGLEKFMTHVPARFTVGLCEAADAGAIGEAIRRATADARNEALDSE